MQLNRFSILSYFVVSTLFFSVFFCFKISAQEIDEKRFYSTLNPKKRIELITAMRVQKLIKVNPSQTESSREEDDKDNSSYKIDVSKYLSEKCGFDYRRDSTGAPIRPVVECQYAPRKNDNPFNGMTSKFDCTFTDEKSKKKFKTLKVKYDSGRKAGGGYKEIPQAVLGTLTARLLGFYTNTYCPVDLICKDCPSENPWADAKSSAKALPGNIVKFENVVVEVKQKGYVVVDSRNQNPEKPQGFYFDREMSQHLPSGDALLIRQITAEREALALWMNFVVSGDADHHNNKLFCVRSEKDQNGQPHCKLAAGLINDYGNSFGYSNPETKLKLSKFLLPTLRIGPSLSWVTTGARGNAGAANYVIGEDGRDLFVKMAEKITPEQWRDVLILAQIELVSDADVNAWISAIQTKIHRIKMQK